MRGPPRAMPRAMRNPRRLHAFPRTNARAVSWPADGRRQLDPIEQQHQVGGIQLEPRRACAGEMEHAPLQALVPETEARAIPVEDLHLVAAPVEKGEHVPRERVLLEHVFAVS